MFEDSAKSLEERSEWGKRLLELLGEGGLDFLTDEVGLILTAILVFTVLIFLGVTYLGQLLLNSSTPPGA